MALQIKANATASGNEMSVTGGKITSWKNSSLNGSHTTTFQYVDANNVGSRSTMTVAVTDTWTGTLDCKTNNINMKLTTKVRFSRSVKANKGGDVKRLIRVFKSPTSSCYVTNGMFNDTITSSITKEITVRSNEAFTLRPNSYATVPSTYIINSASQYITPKSNCSPSNKAADWNLLWSGCAFSGDGKTNCADFMSSGVQFNNSYPTAPGTPSFDITNYDITANGGKTRLFNVNHNCPSGNYCPATTRVVISNLPDFSNTYLDETRTGNVTSGTWDFNGRNLAPNTTYYIRVEASNGYVCEGGGPYSLTKTSSFTTLASNKLSNPQYVNNTRSTVVLSVNNGGGACAVNTTVYYREAGTTNWNTLTTTTETGSFTVNIRNKFEQSKTYEMYAKTTNCTGDYIGETITFAMPTTGVRGVIDSGTTWIDGDEPTAKAKICYTIIGLPAPTTYHLEYRVKGTEVWKQTESYTSSSETASTCQTLIGLYDNTCYEFRTYQQNANDSNYSNIAEYCTPPAQPRVCYICDNLNYMTELICQQVNRIKSGIKTIYANDDTSDFCDPENTNPTLASMYSRVLRFYHAAACLSCDMDAFSMDVGEDKQIYTGEIGWNSLDGTVTEGSDNLPTSNAVAEQVETLLHSVFHPIGNFSFYAPTLTELEAQEGAEEGDTAVVGNHLYRYNTSWEDESVLEHLDNFGVIVIAKGKYANNAYYWLTDGWNLLNTNSAGLEERLGPLETPKVVETNNESTLYNFVVLDDSMTDEQILNTVPTSANETIVYLTEDI